MEEMVGGAYTVSMKVVEAVNPLVSITVILMVVTPL